jgi:putative ABC transport system permease protein
MTLLLTAIFRDYKLYWFKVLCTLLGIIVSLSLFIVIELFSFLFQAPTIESNLSVPFTHKLVHTQGKYTPSDVEQLRRHPLLSNFTPTSETYDYVNHPNIASDILVRGVDRFKLAPLISNIDVANASGIDISPFDLNETFLISATCDTGSKITLKSHLIQKDIPTICIQSNVNQPVLLMDIALFQTLYSTNHSVDSLLYSLSETELPQIEAVLRNDFKHLQLMSFSEEQSQQSQWVDSLTYNLKFLAFISLIVSTCLMIQFFRFLSKQRTRMFEQLYQLGVSSRTIKTLFIQEVGIIAIITNIISLALGYIIATFSLDLFNQIITMFYFKLSSTQLMLHWSIILKAIIASLASFLVATISYFYGKTLGHRLVPMAWMGYGSCSIIAISLGTLLAYPHRWLVMMSTVAMIAGFFGLCISSMSFIGYWLGRIRDHRWVAFKMCRDTLRRDPLSYGAIVFVISLSAGLVISMSLFVSSFSHTVKSWLNTVTFQDIYIQHPANTIQYPMALPSNTLERIQSLTSSDTQISTLYRVPFIYNGYPAQIVFRSQIHNPDVSRFIFKAQRSGPFERNDVIITEPFAMKHRLTIGDTIHLNGILDSPLHVVGIAYDFVSEFGQIIADHALIRPTKWHGIALSVSSDKEIQSIIQALSQMDTINFSTKKRIIDDSMTIFNDTFSFTWFVVFLTACIAIFSLVNLLTIVCMNRQPELIQLFHIGLNARQLTRIILAQITIIGGVSSVISLAIGGCFYVLIVYGIQLPTFNWSIFLHIPWHLLFLTPVVTLGLCLSIGTLFMAIIGQDFRKGRVNESLRNTH